MLGIVYAACVVLIIGFLIFIHELGHFLVAKKVGIRVEAFSLGFGPQVWGFRRGETLYKISAVPLGGYVKMAGEMPGEDGRGDGRDFNDKTISQRAWVVSAGVIMNVLFAFVAFPLAFSLGVPFDAPVVGAVSPDSAAWEAGLLPDDRILRIGDKEILSFNDILGEVAHSDDPKTFHFERNGKEHTRVVTPRYDDHSGMHRVGVGIATEPPRFKAESASGFGLPDDHRIVDIDGIPFSAGAIEHAQASRDPIVVNVLTPAGNREVILEPELETPENATWRLGVVFASLEVTRVLSSHGNGDLAEQAIADAIGVRAKDVITRINGRAVAIRGDVARAVKVIPDGGELRVTVQRPGVGVIELGPREFGAGESIAFLASFSTERNGTRVSVTPGSAAERAGLLTGDEFVSVNGRNLDAESDAVEFIKNAVETSNGSEVAIDVRRAGKIVSLSVMPERARVNVALASVIRTPRPLQTKVKMPFPRSLIEGSRQTVHQAQNILMTFKSLFSGGIATKNLRGILTIAVVSYRFTEQGLAKILFFMGILSLNLAILNILPIPVLDGGHLVFLILEKIKGEPISERAMGWANMTGLVFILGLMVFVTFNDIMTFFF